MVTIMSLLFDELPRNLGLDLVRSTEAAALGAGRWLGLGKARDADKVAAQAMLETLNTVNMNGMIVMGEEGKGEAHYVFKADQVIGTGIGAEVDVVLDPIDGRSQLAKGYPGAVSVAAVAPRSAIRRFP